MTRDELIEAMARATCLESSDTNNCWCRKNGVPCQSGVNEIKPAYKRIAAAALTAIEAQGLAVVPVEATDEMAKAFWKDGRYFATSYRAMIEAGKL